MAALEDILQRHPVWLGRAPQLAAPAVPTGFQALDRELPGGGWPRGALTEILGSQEGIGELELLLPALGALTWAGKRVVWLAPPHLPYAPALAAAGVNLAQLAVVRAPGRRDALWAAEQALRSGSCHALLGWLRRSSYDDLRRLAVAAEGSSAFVALFRPREAAARIFARLPAPRPRARWRGALSRAHPQAPRHAGRCAAAPRREKTRPCSGSLSTFPACRRTPSSRSRRGPASSRLRFRSSRRASCCWKCRAACACTAASRPWTNALPRDCWPWAFPPGCATAPTPRAALWLARGEGEAFEALPVEVTGLDVEFFRSLGVSTVGELLRLPREGLAQRCGAHVAGDLDRALGALPEPRVFFAPPPRFAAGLELPAPVSHAEGLLFGARRLLVQLEGLLAARQAGIRSFALTLLHDGCSDSWCRSVWLRPPAIRSAWRSCCASAWARLTLPQPVEAMRLEAGDFVPLPGRSGAMFGDAAGDAEDWARLVERLRARLGHDAVCGLATHPDHRPEHAWRRVEPGEWDPHEFKAPGPRPPWLLEPRKLNEGEFAAAGRTGAHRVGLVGRRRSEARLLHRPVAERLARLGLSRS